MIFLLGVVFVIVLSIWLWGQETVKTVIKWILGLLILSIFILAANEYFDEKIRNEKVSALQIEQEKKDKVCYEKYEKALEKAKNKLPECSRAIVRYEDEKKNNCRINWDLQNDEGIKAKELYESDKELDDSFNRLIQCAKI